MLSRKRASGAILVVLAFLTTGCADRERSTLTPNGPRAGVVATSWWILFAVAAFVCVLVIVLAVLPLLRRRRSEVDTSNAHRFVLVAGVILPSLVFAGTFALGVHGLVKTESSPTRPTLTVEVVAHQWWWEFRYPDSGAVTADEFHVPVGTPVRLVLRSDDVIHSFWVPEIAPKTDVLPKRVNRTWITVDKPGRYHGECAEFCGVQHAHMAFDLVAESPDQFRAWLDRESTDAATPTSADAQRGEQVFVSSTCATCHTIRGTGADGAVGPDLTHVGSRARLAGGIIANTRGALSGWIADPQSVKPGNRMPPQPLSPGDLHAVVSYLQGLE